MDTKELIQHFSKLSAIDSTASELQIVGSQHFGLSRLQVRFPYFLFIH